MRYCFCFLCDLDWHSLTLSNENGFISLKVWAEEVNRNEFVHFHISQVGMDLSLGPCKQKVLVLFRSSVVSFYDLLFCVISGDIFNATSIYLIKHHLLMKAVHSSLTKIAAQLVFLSDQFSWCRIMVILLQKVWIMILWQWVEIATQ